MKRPALFFILLAAACLLAGLFSYRLSRDQAREAFAAGGVPSAGKSTPAMEVATAAFVSRSPGELLSLKEKLKHSYETNPSATHDWILRGQTSAVLATVPTAELQEWLDELLSLHPDGRWPMTSWDVILAADLLREWGRRDPVAACARKLSDGATTLLAGRMAAFRDWLLRDPTAVARWMDSSDKVPADLRRAWLSERVKTDPRAAVQQLAHLPSETRKASLLEWSTSCALLPAERVALLDAVKEDPKMLEQCAGRMAAALADCSVEEAYAFVDDLKFDERTTDSLDDGIFEKWAMREPKEAFAAWADQKKTRVPESFLWALNSWSMNSPGTEEAIKWVDTVEAGPAKEKIQIYLIGNLTSSERFDQALQMGVSMENREEGKRQVMRVIATLKEKIPGAEKGLWKALKEEGMDLPGEGPAR